MYIRDHDIGPPKAGILIIFVDVKIKKIIRLGKNYPWSKPSNCPRCQWTSIWGHGYVDAYFDGYNKTVWLKRYRCPCCGCVIRVRPKGYFKRIWTPIEEIIRRLRQRLRYGRWPPGISRNRQGHWLRSLRRRVGAYLGNILKMDIMEAFNWFISRGHIPVSRSI